MKERDKRRKKGEKKESTRAIGGQHEKEQERTVCHVPFALHVAVKKIANAFNNDGLGCFVNFHVSKKACNGCPFQP